MYRNDNDHLNEFDQKIWESINKITDYINKENPENDFKFHMFSSCYFDSFQRRVRGISDNKVHPYIEFSCQKTAQIHRFSLVGICNIVGIDFIKTFSD